ncbi:MAG: 50S ribosomal protein L23 [Candidatus Omnitrophica bacterium]|jgi:large subunit ribosomal protein L23|nr:50S ribosomal protein L23 [Candidatus Omnitrophota bacterium]
MISHIIIKSLIRTEKSTLLEPQNKYLFLIEKRANKIQIKHAVEEIYKVKVHDVNTVISPGKLKRVRHQLGKTPDLKKAWVTLKAGQKIDIAP